MRRCARVQADIGHVRWKGQDVTDGTVSRICLMYPGAVDRIAPLQQKATARLPPRQKIDVVIRESGIWAWRILTAVVPSVFQMAYLPGLVGPG